ncbi:MAG TPA: ThuA domain-containing protein [Lacunisphaera sp.]|nr:ThuA domain-containing protein [Lacunisphaera sp.]
MYLPRPSLFAAAALLGLGAVALSAAPLRLLYFTKSAGFEHSVIKETDGRRGYSQKILADLAAKNGFAVTFSKDGSRFSPEYLANFDVIIFYTSGDLLAVGTDGQPAMTPAGKQALLDAVAGGKGFIALHSGTDTFHTGESGGGNNPIRSRRFSTFGDGADPYIRMIGGEFIRHGAQQVAQAAVVDAAFPGCGEIGAAIECREEWYTTKEYAGDDHVLLVMRTGGMKGGDYERPDYPLAWARRYGQGRVAVNVMGHREDVWDSAAYQTMLVGLIKWAGGLAAAELTPNLERVAPWSTTLQPEATAPAKK